MPQFSNFLRNSIIHFRMFLFLVTCFLRVTVSLLCRLQAVSKIHVSIYPHQICDEGDEIVPPCDRHSSETVTLMKHVTNYKQRRKWIVVILGKFYIRGIKIARGHSIFLTKSIILL